MNTTRIVLQLKSWRQLKLIAPQLSRFVFRGLSDADYILKSPLEREAERWKAKRNLLKDVEDHILFEFKRRAHNYIHQVPEHNDLLEWWALIRHYGGLARFLDFTKSCYVASYFAMIDGKDNAAIWAVSKQHLAQFANACIPNLSSLYSNRERIQHKNQYINCCTKNIR